MPSRENLELFREINIKNFKERFDKLLSLMNPKKDYKLVQMNGKRSIEISTRFHGHITFMARELQLDRNYVYFMVLLKATEIRCDGGSPYPYVTVPRKIMSPITMRVETHDLPVPLRTSNRTNKEMMTACFGAELFWAENGNGGCLPEKYDQYGKPE